MDYNELIREKNIENAIKGEISTSLVDILPRLTKKRLYDLAINYNIPGRSKMNKAELVEILVDYIGNVKSLEKALLLAREDEMKLFRTILKSEYLKNDMLYLGEYGYLMGMGLIFSFVDGDMLYFVMPDEIKDLYGEIHWDEFGKRHSRYQYVSKYILALVNLYGAFEVELFIEIFNSQNRHILDMNELLDIYSKLSKREQTFWIAEGHIISEYFLSFEDGFEELVELLMNREDKPHYIPERGELLKYADSAYFEWTPQLEVLQSFILEEMCDDKEIVKGLVDDIQLSCSMEADLQSIFSEFERREIYINDEGQLRKLIPLIMDVYNNTRLWANCGHTPKEMMDMSREVGSEPFNQQRRVTKIGRNEPCPCGSGKKYKKCCGR